ncbi:MAG: hypothetical protein DMF84_29855 [Acidobacteria bacterium]|nr:MAG: hypothetical protein DMF84_29855 [Acidobacteriota bacterium]
MTYRHQEPIDHDLLVALHRLAHETVVPPPDPSREAALLAAFDAARSQCRHSWAGYWWMAALTTAAALLIAVVIGPGTEQPGNAGLLASHPVTVSEFVPWPGAHELPPLESGELLRVDLPVSMLPALGMMPPAIHGTSVKADLIVGQDGLTRAVRLVSD